MDTQDGASWKNEDGNWKLRDPKKTKQRKMRRGKKREERRKYGHSAKRRAEYKADAQVKARAMAQASLSGGDDTAGVNDNSYNPTGSVTEGTFQYGGSMKTNQSGGGYNAENPAAAARQLKRNQRKAGRREVVRTKNKEKGTKTKFVSRSATSPSGVQHREWKQTTKTKGEKGKDVMSGTGYGRRDSEGGMQISTMKSGVPVFRSSGEGKLWSGKDAFDSDGNYSKAAKRQQKRMGASMNAHQDKEASMDDYSHEKKLGADGRYDLEHGHKDWAKNDFDHAHALKKDAHHDAEQRKHAHPILKHMRRF